MTFERPFGQWTPDLPDLQNPGLIQAKNVYPSPNGYAPFWDSETTGISVTGTVLGSRRFERSDGTEVLCVGTSGDLYVIVSGAANASSLGLSVDTEENWSFEQFGAAVYATVKSGGSYYLTDIDSDVSFSASPGTPPKGNALARVDDHLIYGDLTDTDTSDQPFRIRWSAFNNAQATYETDLATLSGFVDMPSHLGPVTGISGGQVGLVFQKFGVSRIDGGNAATAFNKVIISKKIGCVGNAAFVSLDNRWFWLSQSGFAMSDGASVQLISTGKVWDWFLENANTEKLHKVQASVNYDRRCIIWNFFGLDLTTYTNQIIYHWDLDSWSNSVISVDWLVPVTYDGAFGEGDPRLRRILGGFISGTLYEFSGDALEATFETGEFEIAPGRRVFMSAVRPMIENADHNNKISVKYRNLPGETKTATTSTEEGALGFLPVNVDARYVSTEIVVPAAADWDKGAGVQFDAVPTGLV